LGHGKAILFNMFGIGVRAGNCFSHCPAFGVKNYLNYQRLGEAIRISDVVLLMMETKTRSFKKSQRNNPQQGY
jgi:hypothetical protein